MDTGISFKYPKLLEYLTNFDITQKDNNGHGTHVISTILKDACPQVKITICKNWDKSWSHNKIFKETYQCYKKAIELKVDVFHYSGGGIGKDKLEEFYIQKMKKNSTLLVAAVGNEGKDLSKVPYYPASYNYSNIIPVGALDTNGLPAGFSNYGKDIIWMPGVDVVAYGLNGLVKMKGTSMAAANYTNMLVKRFCKGLK